ncbi:hypothetical protein Tco_0118026 [Tanacetum coccineum]
MTQTVPSKRTANVFYQGTTRTATIPKQSLSQSTESKYCWITSSTPQNGNPEEDLKDYAIIDSGCSGRGRITGKGTIKTSCIDFEKVSYVEELKFNLLSFKFVDEDLVILRAPRKNDVYSLDLKNIIPSGGVTCLVAKATKDEAVLWHKRLGHLIKKAQRNAFEEEKKRIALEKGKESANSTLTLSTANTPSQSTGNTPTDSDDDVPKDGVSLQISFDDEKTDNEGKPLSPASTPIEAHKSLGKDEVGKMLMYIFIGFKSLQSFYKTSELMLGWTHQKDETDDQLQEDVNILGKTIGFFPCQSNITKQLWAISSTENKEVKLILLMYSGERILVAPLKDISIFNSTSPTEHNIDFPWSLIVDPDLIGPWLQQFWATASLRVINEVPHLAPQKKWVAGKRVLIQRKPIGAEFTYSKIADGHISNGTPFLMYPRFIQLFLNKQLEGVTRPQNFLPSVTLPSKVFTFMRKNSPKFSGRITLDSTYVRGHNNISTEEAHSTVLIQWEIKVTLRDAQVPLLKLLLNSSPSSTTELPGTAEAQANCLLEKKLFDAYNAVTPDLERKVMKQKSRPRGLSIPGPMQSQPQQPTQSTDPKEKGKGILVEEPKKKKLTLQQIRALETANDRKVMQEEERKRLEDLKKPKPKTISKKPTSLAQERTQMMNFLKGQGYKNLQKLRYPQMKELYDKVQESIKDSFKDFIPMGSEKEKQIVQK